MEEIRVKVTVEVNGEEKKVMEGTGAVVMMYAEMEDRLEVDEWAHHVNPLLVVAHLSTVRDKEIEPGVSVMHDVMNVIRDADKKANSLLGKIRRFFTKP